VRKHDLSLLRIISERSNDGSRTEFEVRALDVKFDPCHLRKPADPEPARAYPTERDWDGDADQHKIAGAPMGGVSVSFCEGVSRPGRPNCALIQVIDGYRFDDHLF
jgi:hypothetical protein